MVIAGDAMLRCKAVLLLMLDSRLSQRPIDPPSLKEDEQWRSAVFPFFRYALAGDRSS